MILHNNDEELNKVTYFFVKNFNAEFMLDYFDINVSNDIYHDYLQFDNALCLEGVECAGITIPPQNTNTKIQILISDKHFFPDTIFHELAHTYDFIKFSQKFCGDNLKLIQQNKYYFTLVNWSEFHAKLIEIPYSQIFVNMLNNISAEDTLNYYRSNISTFYYQEYNKKLLEKTKISLRDVMWYIGEITLCNLCDIDKSYNIPQKIINRCGTIMIDLYNLLYQCLDFESFANNIILFQFLLNF